MADFPTKEQIEVRAYELYVARGYEDGHAEEDWHEAERQLAGEGGAPSEKAAGPSGEKARRQRRASGGQSRAQTVEAREREAV